MFTSTQAVIASHTDPSCKEPPFPQLRFGVKATTGGANNGLVKFTLWNKKETGYKRHFPSKGEFKSFYYSFKIFLRFWLAKSTSIIHHYQLLLTTFWRILRLTNRWQQKCSTLVQVDAPLTKKIWRRGWVVLVKKRKMVEQSAEHFIRFTTNYWLKT